ncbi:MAG: glycosyl transferase family 2 [Bryobacterales bacterium]|nr:glycosyl transferase family 2 [Bryobacterales bacterium]
MHCCPVPACDDQDLGDGNGLKTLQYGKNMTESQPKIVVVTPVRDEAPFIVGMLDSITRQSIQPTRWIIVDDGSSDGTPDIVERFAAAFPFIELVRLPRREGRLPGGEGAIGKALSMVVAGELDYLARFDADLLFGPDYFKQLVGEFESDPLLGIAGGMLFTEDSAGQLKPETAPEYHVRGALKMYRRQCFLATGTLANCIGWDTIDEIRAWTNGWVTRSFAAYRVVHRRPTGTGIHVRKAYWERGKAEYNTLSHPLFVFAKSVHLLFRKRMVVGGFCLLGGFLWSYIKRETRLQDPNFKRVRHVQQWRRVMSRLRGEPPMDGVRRLALSFVGCRSSNSSVALSQT